MSLLEEGGDYIDGGSSAGRPFEWVTVGMEVMVGLGFCVGILLMNIPQHYLCWKHRSADGLSLAYILICTISNATLALATIMGDYNEIMTQLLATTTTTTATTVLTTTETDIFSNTSTTSSNNSILLIEANHDNDSSTEQRSMLWFWAASFLPSEEPIPGLLRCLKTLNAAMPTIQNFMSLWIGVPSLLVYYFWFSRPQPQQQQQQKQQTYLATTKHSTTKTICHDNVRVPVGSSLEFRTCFLMGVLGC